MYIKFSVSYLNKSLWCVCCNAVFVFVVLIRWTLDLVCPSAVSVVLT